ncbi:unnamed protein product [Durusdinium trenchii]|uniref:Uncharacterized protein n=1 Tax=Durusdinium trenchii TaxID=1381693 RepID=A0ABP0NUU5_9DINO
MTWVYMLCFPMFSPTDVFDDRGVGSLSRKTIGRSTLGPMAHDYDETDLGSLVEDMSSIPLKNPAEEGDERVELEQEEASVRLRRPEGASSGSRSMKPPLASRIDSRKDLRRPAPYRYDAYEQDDTFVDEPFRWSDAWGLICGLILLIFIVSVLSWAYLEDLREARELEEARARGVEL